MTTDGIADSESKSSCLPLQASRSDGCRETVTAATAIRGKVERIKRREVEEALSTLEARGDLTASQRENLEEMSYSLVDSLLASPIEELSQTTDPATLRTALDLFDIETRPTSEPLWQDNPILTEVNDDD